MSSKLMALTGNARGLAENGRSFGVFPYQWLTPGRNASPVLVINTTPTSGTGAASVIAAEYVVPEGMRFILRGLVFEFIGSGWTEGSQQLLLSITIEAPGGSRPVPYLSDLNTELGSRKFGAYEMPAMIEAFADNTVTATLEDDGTIGPGSTVLVHLVGYEFPETEAV